MGQAGRGATPQTATTSPSSKTLPGRGPGSSLRWQAPNAPRRDLAAAPAARCGSAAMAMRAARMEMAARRRVERARGSRPCSGRERAPARLEPRHLGQQRLRVGVVRARRRARRSAPISTMRPRYIIATRSAICSHHAEIVADEEIGQVELAPQLHEQVEHLRLDRDVERGDRLVADQQLRAAPRARGRCRCARAARRRTGADSGASTPGRARRAPACSAT